MLTPVRAAVRAIAAPLGPATATSCSQRLPAPPPNRSPATRSANPSATHDWKPAATWQTHPVIRFGIQDYQPSWLNGHDAITATHGRRLAGLAGRRLRHVWLVWDLDTDEWFTDAPVLLDFGAEQVEIDHQKFDDLSITWNTIDPSRPIEDSYFHLAWRAEPLPDLTDLPGRRLCDVALLEWAGDPPDMADNSLAVGFDLAPAWLTVFNALDENGLEHQPPGSRYRPRRMNP